MTQATMTRFAAITRAEARVLDELLRDGASNRTIARRLNLSEHTAKAHVKRIIAAAECTDRTSLVVAAFRNGIHFKVGRSPATPRPRPKTAIEHGTLGGYFAHHRRNKDMCNPCKTVGAEHMQRIRSARAKAAA